MEVLHGLMRAHPLAALISLDASGIVAEHIPMETNSTPAPFGVLRGHVARANPIWRNVREGSQALAIFQGPQTYISPSFYPSKRETGEVVPTWNYAVVHARGTLRFIEDAQWLHALVSRLTAAHESTRELPWKLEDAPAPYVDKMLASIVGFEFPILTLSGKWKVSQNRSAADQRGVVAGLRAAKDADSQAIAELLASRGG